MKPVVRFLLVVLAVPVLVFGFFFIKALADPQAEARMRARDAIELCRKESERKSLAPGDKRFVAGTCDTMEKRFKEQYGVNPY